jgi:predicted aspartyl protease
MWSYDHSEFPAFPSFDIQIFKADLPTRSVSLRAKLDTGASITVIPEQFVAWLNLPIRDHLQIKGYDGASRLRPVYGIDLKFNGFDLYWIDCIAIQRKNVLLGRNVLNRFFIALDGPNLTFDIK